jgi:hypothetical protein
MDLDERMKQININLANAIKALKIANQQAEKTLELMRGKPKKPDLKVVK